jgi:hypothetical protein
VRRFSYPEFDETQLTFAPDERFFTKNNCKKDELKQGNSIVEDQELRFFKLMMIFEKKSKRKVLAYDSIIAIG